MYNFVSFFPAGLTTDYASYILTQPSKEYEPFMKEVNSKVFTGKSVIEQLRASRDNQDILEYEDLLHFLEGKMPPAGLPRINEDMIVKHADFAVQMVKDKFILVFYLKIFP